MPVYDYNDFRPSRERMKTAVREGIRFHEESGEPDKEVILEALRSFLDRLEGRAPPAPPRASHMRLVKRSEDE